MRIEWKGPAAQDLAGLSRALWDPALDSGYPADAHPGGGGAVDGGKGIDSLAQLCQERLAADPFSGCLFVFRSRRGTAIVFGL